MAFTHLHDLYSVDERTHVFPCSIHSGCSTQPTADEAEASEGGRAGKETDLATRFAMIYVSSPVSSFRDELVRSLADLSRNCEGQSIYIASTSQMPADGCTSRQRL